MIDTNSVTLCTGVASVVNTFSVIGELSGFTNRVGELFEVLNELETSSVVPDDIEHIDQGGSVIPSRIN